ncbi:MAG: hypothetical protein ACLQHS_06660 [Candidatus Limnocylindrales bacterium]
MHAGAGWAVPGSGKWRAAAVVLVLSLSLSVATAAPVAAQATPGPITPPYIVVAQLGSGSALGVTTVGPFSAATKTRRLGAYVTVRWTLRPATAGQRIDVYVTTKAPSGSWGPWRLLTARLTDARGMAYFHWRSEQPVWLSVQGRFAGAVHLTSARGPAVQIRWR